LAELENAGLTQRALSRFLDKDPVTVNRWCRAREDALEVPQYARAFVIAYRLLSPAARRELSDAFELSGE
jgi:hypothetical protein